MAHFKPILMSFWSFQAGGQAQVGQGVGGEWMRVQAGTGAVPEPHRPPEAVAARGVTVAVDHAKP